LGSNNKVFKSTDFGVTWIDVSTGLGKGGIQALLFDGTNLFAGTPADAVGVYRSTNGGANWNPAAAGLPVRDIPPQGAIYLSIQFDLIGRRGFRTNDDVRRFLLREAGFAVVPFQAFGLAGENGWFRSSVGAVSVRDIDEALPRVEAALRKALA